MEMKRNKQVPLFVWFLVAVLLSQNLVIPVMSSSFDDQKTYYSPDPHAGTPPSPRGSHHTPSHSTPPSHGSGGGGGCGGSPPSCGGYTPPPASNCGTPPHSPTPRPSTPRTPPYSPTPRPSTPRTPPYSPTPRPSTPRTPPYSPTPRPSTPRTPPNDPSRTPPTPSGGYYRPPTPLVASPPPTTPTPIVTSPPPYTPSPIFSSPPPTDPGTPSTPGYQPGTPIVPTPPFLPGPSINPFPGTCNYWSTHPGLIWGIFGWWATVGGAFGTHSLPGFGAGLSLHQALSNTRNDGFGSLYREGTASLLNSMVNNKFPFTTDQVRERFVSALSSNKAAAHQAHQFKLANEGRIKPRA